MEVSSIFKQNGEQVLVIIGNGTYEKKLLHALAPKFNGIRASLVITSLPISKKTGLAALEGLASILTRGYYVEKALFIIDKEHINDFNDIKSRLGEYGFMIEEYKELTQKVALFDLSRGINKVKLYAVITGDVKCINEEIAKLASQVYGKEVKPRNVKHIKIKELLSKATLEAIKKSLEGLAFVLQYIEKN
ncbi:MAG: hypothetical protein QXI58_01610 [Candidatus Micrarchaeia archaeon]